jgi:hypothetical protein
MDLETMMPQDMEAGYGAYPTMNVCLEVLPTLTCSSFIESSTEINVLWMMI